MGLEVGTYISDLVATNPVNATDPVSQGDDHLRLIKSTLLATFPNITGAITASHAELNILDGATLSTAELNILDGVTLTAAQINDAAQLSVANVFTASLPITLSNGTPALRWYETDQGADGKEWRFRASGGNFTVSTYTDAGVLGSSAITIGRSGTTIGTIALAGTGITLNGVNVTDYARLSQNNVFTGTTQTISAASANLHLLSSNTSAYIQISTSSTSRSYIGAGTVNSTAGGAATDIGLRSVSGGLIFSGDDGNTAHFKLDNAGKLTTPNASAQEVGTKGPQARAISGSDSTAASDQGNAIVYTGSGGHTLTLDSDPPTNAMVIIVNEGSASLTIAASGSLIFAGSTGNRTLAPGCMAAAYHRQGSGVWQIAGQLS